MIFFILLCENLEDMKVIRSEEGAYEYEIG